MVVITLTDAKQPLTGAQRVKRYRQKRGNYFDANQAVYLGRRFVAVDGEGINVRKGARKDAHDYVLLAISDVPPLIAEKGLRTLAILSYLWTNLSNENNNVIYGGSYDFNCWCADMPEHVLREMYAGRRVRYGPYSVRWMKGKRFSITRDDRTVNIYDVVSFFQCPFLQACDEYLGDYEGRDIIAREKARRGDFTFREVAKIGAYNNLELQLLERLCTELRLRLNKAGLRPRQWIGPGAIAASLFLRENVKAHMSRDIPEPVAEAARYAYAGGRFECLKYGVSHESAWEYDINSAYPKALSLVPSLAGGTWVHRTQRIRIAPGAFALYRIRWENLRTSQATIPGPGFVRASNGTISYPMSGTNWIWSPEAELFDKYSQITGMQYKILESWTLKPATNHKPFGFVPAMYERRKALKAGGDGAHIGIKLGLNSMYHTGKPRNRSDGTRKRISRRPSTNSNGQDSSPPGVARKCWKRHCRIWPR